MVAFLLLLTGCSQNERVKLYGEQMVVHPACDHKVLDMEWDETSFWFSTRKMQEGDAPETIYYNRQGAYGTRYEAAVKIIETRCDD